MKKFEKLDEAKAPDGTVLTLYRHDLQYYIRVHGVELMSTRRHNSEEQLAEVVCAPLRTVSRARVLIGGLGFGFTLRAALHTLNEDAEVIVVELVEAVIRWNQNPEYNLAHEALLDDRVSVRNGDIAVTLASSPNSYDAIMLDVDNGAEALTDSRNKRLYAETGIELAISALRKNGELAYWSHAANAEFAESLRRTGLSVRTVEARAHSTGGPRHVIYIAT